MNPYFKTSDLPIMGIIVDALESEGPLCSQTDSEGNMTCLYEAPNCKGEYIIWTTDGFGTTTSMKHAVLMMDDPEGLAHPSRPGIIYLDFTEKLRSLTEVGIQKLCDEAFSIMQNTVSSTIQHLMHLLEQEARRELARRQDREPQS